VTAFSAQQQRDFFSSLPSDLAAVLSSPSASARKGEGEVKALSEQKQKDVFAVVEACVRMLLMRLAEREKEISGEGDAGDSNTAKAGSGGGEEGEGEHEGGGGGGGWGGGGGGGGDAGEGAGEAAGAHVDFNSTERGGTAAGSTAQAVFKKGKVLSAQLLSNELCGQVLQGGADVRHSNPWIATIKEAMMTTIALTPLRASESRLCVLEDGVLAFLANAATSYIARSPASFSPEGGPPPVLSISEDNACGEAVDWLRGLIGLFRVLNMNVASVLQEMQPASTFSGYAKIVKQLDRRRYTVVYRDDETARITDSARVVFYYGHNSERGARREQLQHLSTSYDASTGERKSQVYL